MMDNNQGIICLALEKALADESVAPVDLPFWFLEAITDNFSDKQQIGSGGFASVYKGVLRNGIVAVKKLHNKIEVQEKDFQREVACLIDVKHRNIVRFLGYCYETQHKVYQHEGRHVLVDKRNMLFCFEFLSRGSLANYITRASSGLQWRLCYQIIKGICEGVGYLHQQRIIHMDLKPDNILLDDSMVPRIADFGISRRFSENQSKIITENKVGSLGYMAPEFLKYGRITFKTDIYSLGVIIIEILMGCKECPNVDKVLEGWTNTFGTSKSTQVLEQVKVCAEIGIDCMHDDPSRRPDTQDIICRLNEMERVPEQLAKSLRGGAAGPGFEFEPRLPITFYKAGPVWSISKKKKKTDISEQVEGRSYLPAEVRNGLEILKRRRLERIRLSAHNALKQEGDNPAVGARSGGDSRVRLHSNNSTGLPGNVQEKNPFGVV